MPRQMLEQRKNKSYFQPDQIHQAGNDSKSQYWNWNPPVPTGILYPTLIIIGLNPQPLTRSSALPIKM